MSRKGWSMTKLCVLVTTALLVCLMLGAAPVGAVSGPRYVDQNLTRNCGGNTPCHTTIQAAVIAAQPGDTIYVYPGTYGEGVNLNAMPTDGDLALVTVNNGGVPTPGTVTVDNPGDDSEIYTGDPLMRFNGDVTIDGFVLSSAYRAIDVWVGPLTTAAAEGGDMGLGPTVETRDVEIRNVDASHTGEDGIAARADGNVTITNCTTNGNKGAGIYVYQTLGAVTITGCTSNENVCAAAAVSGGVGCQGIFVMGVGGQVTIRNSTANGNDGAGIAVSPRLVASEEVGLGSATTPDQVIIDRCTANQNGQEGIQVYGAGGDVTITDCTTNANDQDGVYLRGLRLPDELGSPLVIDGGDVVIENCTAIGNRYAGFDPEGIRGTLSIQACIARDNHTGVDLYSFGGPESVLVNGNIICGNEECGVDLGGLDSLGVNVLGMNLEGN